MFPGINQPAAFDANGIIPSTVMNVTEEICQTAWAQYAGKANIVYLFYVNSICKCKRKSAHAHDHWPKQNVEQSICETMSMI